MKLNTNKINSFLINIFKKISYTLSTLFLGILVIVLLIGSIYIKLNEQSEFIFFDIYWILFSITHIAIIYLILKNNKKIKNNHLFIFFSLIYLIFGIYFIVNLSDSIRADGEIVYRSANLFRDGDYRYFAPKNYLNFYPHQHGLLYYNYILTFFFKSPKVLFIANFVEVIFINYFIYKISDLLNNSDQLKNNLTIYLSFAFTQQFVFISFGYNLIPGFFFMIIGLYFIIKYKKTNKYKDFIIGIFSLIISCLIRSNFIIAVIALFLYLWITSEKNNKKISIKFLIIFFVANKILSFGMNSLTEKITKIEVNSGMPKILWVAMGTDPENWDFGPGWYNGYTRKVLDNVDYDYEKAQKIGKEKVITNLRYHLSNPLDSLKFFGAKFLTTWAEPTYESIWSGPHERFDQINKSDLLNSLYDEGHLHWITTYYMKSTQIFIYGLVLYYLLNKKIYKENLIIFIIYFIGGVIFHLIWETKSQYVYPYVILMIPIASEAIDYIYRNKQVNFIKNKKTIKKI